MGQLKFCDYCKIKKLSGLFSFSCKCNYKNLCSKCRYPDDHKCAFDYREQGKIELNKQNPKIKGEQLEKI